MPRTLSDDDWKKIEGRLQVADFSESIFNDPALSKDAKRLIKRKYPNISIPDYDLEERFESERAADKKERADAEAAAKRKQEEDGWKAERGRVQKDYGYTDEGMTDLEKLMTEKNIGSYEVAATYHTTKNPKPSDPTYSHHGEPWGHSTNETFREIAKDPEAWGRSELMKAMRVDQERARGGR